MNSSRPFARALLAFAIYQAAAILWFGIPVLDNFSHSYISINYSSDASGYMWFLTWWPYAIAHRVNPFITRLVWAPAGFNVTWSHCVPLPALLAAPITHLWGPIVSWNVLCLIAPALAAWCAFILCDHLCRSFLPALVGGYLFGFSPYMLGHLLGHLSLILIFPVPLAVLLVVLRLEGRLSRAGFVALFAIVAVVQFLCCHEILATTVFFGAIAILIAILAMGPAVRRRLWEVSALAGLGLTLAAIALIPFLYYAFFAGFPRGPIFPATTASSDLLAFLIPPPLLLIGLVPPVNSLAMRISGGFAEDTAYVGLPMLLLVLDYALTFRTKRLTWLMVVALIVAALASLGPILHTAGTVSIRLPAALLAWIPLMDKALPGRFMMFAFLDLALITALYLSTAPRRVRKWVLAAISVASLIPNLTGGWWIAQADTPQFFADGAYKRYLQKNETVLVLPYGWRGKSMLWQVQTRMYFRMAGGFLGRTPAEALRWPATQALYSGQPSFDFARQLKFFLGAHDVKSIIVAGDARQRWPALLEQLHLTGGVADDVLLYEVPDKWRRAYADVTAGEAARSAATAAFAAMVTAANAYWAKALPLDKLTPWEAARLNLLSLPPSPAAPAANDPHWWDNLWLGKFGDSTVAIGVYARYEDLVPVVDRFGPAAKERFFPFPEKLRAPAPDAVGQLLMTFDREALARAANQAAMPPKLAEKPNPH